MTPRAPCQNFAPRKSIRTAKDLFDIEMSWLMRTLRNFSFSESSTRLKSAYRSLVLPKSNDEPVTDYYDVETYFLCCPMPRLLETKPIWNSTSRQVNCVPILFKAIWCNESGQFVRSIRWHARLLDSFYQPSNCSRRVRVRTPTAWSHSTVNCISRGLFPSPWAMVQTGPTSMKSWRLPCQTRIRVSFRNWEKEINKPVMPIAVSKQ